jgi:hypothetical protein
LISFQKERRSKYRARFTAKHKMAIQRHSFICLDTTCCLLQACDFACTRVSRAFLNTSKIGFERLLIYIHQKSLEVLRSDLENWAGPPNLDDVLLSVIKIDKTKPFPTYLKI